MAVLLGAASWGATASEAQPLPGKTVAPGVCRVGHLSQPHLTESSGIVASRQYPGVFWTHNDGGGGRRQILYAVTRSGAPVGECVVTGVRLEDWEDIALADPGRLYIGDVGNNRKRRTTVAVYEVAEPNPKAGGTAAVGRSWQLQYPAEPFDCEALFVWKDYGYLVSKVFNNERACIYRFALADSARPVPLERVARLRVESPVTGADISADGRQLALVAKAGAYVFPIEGDPLRAGSLRPQRTRFSSEQIEGCCFVPEGLLATSESREIFLFTDEPFRPLPRE